MNINIETIYYDLDLIFIAILLTLLIAITLLLIKNKTQVAKRNNDLDKNINKKTNESNTFIQYVVFFFVLYLVFRSNSQWCYLFIIILICLRMKFIDPNTIDIIKDCLSVYNKNISNLSQAKIDMIQNEEDNKLNKDIHNFDDNKIKDVGWKPYLVSGKLKFKSIEEKAISYLKKTTGIDFEMNKQIAGRHQEGICPDGIKFYKNNDKLAEIKAFITYDENIIYETVTGKLNQYYSFYIENYPNRNVTFYFLVILNKDFDSKKIITIQKHIRMYFARYNREYSNVYDLNLSIITVNELDDCEDNNET